MYCTVLTQGGRHHQNTTDELEEKVDVLEVTVLELGEDLDTAEMSIDTLQIDVGVLNTNLEGNVTGPPEALLFDRNQRLH